MGGQTISRYGGRVAGRFEVTYPGGMVQRRVLVQDSFWGGRILISNRHPGDKRWGGFYEEDFSIHSYTQLWDGFVSAAERAGELIQWERWAVLELLRKTVAEWFPTAAKLYAREKWEQFVDTDTRVLCWSKEACFERVMPWFWEQEPVAVLIPDDQREQFEAAVYEAIEAQVWAAVADIVYDAAADDDNRRRGEMHHNLVNGQRLKFEGEEKAE